MNETAVFVPAAPAPAAGGVVPFHEPGQPASEFRVNILLVDDRPDKLLAVESVLAPLGQNLVLARSGDEALRHLLKQDFAVILLDVSMPGMDGFETASLIRQRLNSEHTPIIFVTSIGITENQIAHGYSLGAVDYILSPIVAEVLQTKVSVFVHLHQQRELVKRQAEQVRRLNRELEQRVAALTDANRELEAFNYSIAHDLRAPLRAMSGFAQALIEDEGAGLSRVGVDYAGRIARSAKYMDSLLLDLLAYSRLARADLPPVLTPLDDPVNELLPVMEPEILKQGARVKVRSPLATVFAHPPTLKQILSNLIGNSLKFVAPGRPPVIEIFTVQQGDSVRLCVEDNGIGIPPEHQDKIFSLFHRLHDAQTYPGTGIGLALVRKGAERMGGRAGVESQEGQGSRFWVDLPAPEGTEHER